MTERGNSYHDLWWAKQNAENLRSRINKLRALTGLLKGADIYLLDCLALVEEVEDNLRYFEEMVGGKSE